MIAEPPAMPVTIPSVAPIVATPVLLLLHVPPLVALASVVVAPAHTLVVPVMAVARELTVTVVVAEQPAEMM